MVRREEYQKTGESVKNEGMMDGLDSWGTDGGNLPSEIVRLVGASRDADRLRNCIKSGRIKSDNPRAAQGAAKPFVARVNIL